GGRRDRGGRLHGGGLGAQRRRRWCRGRLRPPGVAPRDQPTQRDDRRDHPTRNALLDPHPSSSPARAGPTPALVSGGRSPPAEPLAVQRRLPRRGNVLSPIKTPSPPPTLPVNW